MSATRAMQRRAGRNWRENVLQAHDRLHKGDVEAAHELVHVALGLEEEVEHEVAPLALSSAFDADFRALCVKYGAKASYILVDRYEEEKGGHRIISGGDGELCAALRALKPSVDA